MKIQSRLQRAKAAVALNALMIVKIRAWGGDRAVERKCHRYTLTPAKVADPVTRHVAHEDSDLSTSGILYDVDMIQG